MRNDWFVGGLHVIRRGYEGHPQYGVVLWRFRRLWTLDVWLRRTLWTFRRFDS